MVVIPFPLTPSPPPLYHILITNLMSVPEMYTSMLPIEITSCENETKELSTFFSSVFYFEAGDDGFSKPSLHFNFPRPIMRFVIEATSFSSPLLLLLEVSLIYHSIPEGFHWYIHLNDQKNMKKKNILQKMETEHRPLLCLSLIPLFPFSPHNLHKIYLPCFPSGRKPRRDLCDPLFSLFFHAQFTIPRKKVRILWYHLIREIFMNALKQKSPLYKTFYWHLHLVVKSWIIDILNNFNKPSTWNNKKWAWSTIKTRYDDGVCPMWTTSLISVSRVG